MTPERMMRRTKTIGFTLIEMMTAIVITAILLTLATPYMAEFIKNRRITSATNRLFESIQTARTEAIKRGAMVVMCRTGDPNDLGDTFDDDPVCGASVYPSGDANTSREWGKGWLVYALPVGNETANNFAKETDALLAVGGGGDTGVDITSDVGSGTFVAFFGDGSLNRLDPAVFAICDERGAGSGRMITIPRLGRPHIGEATACTPT